MKSILSALCMMAFLFTSSHLLQAADQEKAEGKGMKEMCNSCYVCEKCGVASLKPGKCEKCGAELKGMHILGAKATVSCCSCGVDCKCELKNEDATTCSCGKPIVKAEIKCPHAGKIAQCPGCGKKESKEKEPVKDK